MRVSMTIRFSNQIVAELIQPFWAAWQAGEFMTDASAVAGTYRQRGLAWVRAAGVTFRGVTCPLVSEKKSHSVVLGVSRSVPSPGVWGGRRPRSVGNWPATATLPVPTCLL